MRLRRMPLLTKRTVVLPLSLITAALVVGGCDIAGPSRSAADTAAAHRLHASAQRVLDYLTHLPDQPDHRVLIGQHLGTIHELPERGARTLERIHQTTERHPALLGADYQHWESPPGPLRPGNDWLIQAARQGSVISLSWHADNPWTQGPYDDLRGIDFHTLMDPRSAVAQRWQAELDRVARGLAELRDAQVVVLWRPFHEMNGDWFWWSQFTREQFVQLWRQMFERFEQQHHLDHLLWVYSPHVVRSSTRSALHFYPGDSYVDITALDAYDGPETLAGYQELVALKKPFGLGEFGPPENERDGTFDNRRLIESIRRTHPRTTFVLYWNSWQDQHVALIDNRHARNLMADDWVVTREQLLRQRQR